MWLGWASECRLQTAPVDARRSAYRSSPEASSRIRWQVPLRAPRLSLRGYASLFILRLTANQRFGMAFEIVGERTERCGRACQFAHGVGRALRQRGVRLQRAIGGDKRVVRSGQRGTRLRRDLSVERFEQTSRVGQGLMQILADGFERNLVQLCDKTGDRVLQPLQI